MQSPLVDPTAWHKNICIGYRTAAPDSVDCHRLVTARQFEKRTIRARIATYYLPVSHYKGQNSIHSCTGPCFGLRYKEDVCFTHKGEMTVVSMGPGHKKLKANVLVCLLLS